MLMYNCSLEVNTGFPFGALSIPISSHLYKSIEVLDEGPLAVDEYDTAEPELASSGERE